MEHKEIHIPMINPPNLRELGVEKGWFLRAGCLEIWLEISEVLSGDAVIAASRDPAKGTQLYKTGDFFASIMTLSSCLPRGHWIKLNREKNFFDKKFPNELPVNPLLIKGNNHD